MVQLILSAIILIKYFITRNILKINLLYIASHAIEVALGENLLRETTDVYYFLDRHIRYHRHLLIEITKYVVYNSNLLYFYQDLTIQES